MQAQNIGIELHSAMLKCRKHFTASCEALASSRKALTGSIRATIAVAHGVPSGRIEEVRTFTQSQLDLTCDWLCQWFGASCEWSVGSKRDFDRTIRTAVSRALEGRARVRVSATFRYMESRQGLPCTIRYRDPDHPERMIGLDITLVVGQGQGSDEFEEDGSDDSTVDAPSVDDAPSAAVETLQREDGSESGMTVETVRAMAQFAEKTKTNRRIRRFRTVYARMQAALGERQAALEAARAKIAAQEAALEAARAKIAALEAALGERPAARSSRSRSSG